MAEPRVSIVILSHNRPEALAEALASVVAQTVRDREIVVVDNPSPTSGRIAAVVAAQPEARLIGTGRNLGFAGAFGLAEICHADDVVTGAVIGERFGAGAERRAFHVHIRPPTVEPDHSTQTQVPHRLLRHPGDQLPQLSAGGFPE